MIAFYLTYAVFVIGSFLWCKKIFAEAAWYEKLIYWPLYLCVLLVMYMIIGAFFTKQGWL